VNTSSLPINISDDKIIIIEEKDKTKLKGDSIRTGIKYVQDHYGEDNIIAFQEPEKVSMIQEYPRLIQGMNQKCILVPKRSEHSWSSYPVEQYHSEHFMNMYLTNITNDLFIDWSFGPVLFTGNVSNYFLKETDQMWNAQINPIYRAYLDDISILSQVVNFTYPVEQRICEECNLKYIEKRRYQLNYMVKSMLKYTNSLHEHVEDHV
jgi:hypothetical protein